MARTRPEGTVGRPVHIGLRHPRAWQLRCPLPAPRRSRKATASVPRGRRASLGEAGPGYDYEDP
ncbi:hypothetical protein N7471_010552 [Penicillium samsonianum]|uniref:uncharacterized protein n=1 Tax=Penicillium samsonianum TaxID=1882272 RepID=UPI0025468965|nr:uncharacterized protein N7471_010552 [Penicillium samsonianum]KAJ6126059.1 hypothetical protein N7471_010552 [Penicillium samsonianum]